MMKRFITAITTLGFLCFATAQDINCTDSLVDIQLGTKVASCSEGANPNGAWLCNYMQFKEGCPVTCGVCKCTDSLDDIKLGTKIAPCSEGADPSGSWLCSYTKFKEGCPVTCNACGGGLPPVKEDGITIKGNLYTCPDVEGKDWLCTVPKFKKQCSDECLDVVPECSDTSDTIKLGQKDATCSEGTSVPWLCKNKLFKKKCPVSCNACGGGLPPVKKDGITIKGNLYTCPDVEGKDWLCTVPKFKKQCSDECPDVVPECSDSSDTIKLGNKDATCSEGTDPNLPWLCKNKLFKMKCPVSCNACGSPVPINKIPVDKNQDIECTDSLDIVKLGKTEAPCSEGLSTPWLCKNKLFRKKCPLSCDICGPTLN